MPKFITVPTELLKPTQEYLKLDSLETVLTLYKTHFPMILPPPVVRFYQHSYLILDGHNRTAVSAFLGNSSLLVSCAEDSQDSLDIHTFPQEMTSSILQSNRLINERFYSVCADQSLVSKRGILKIQDMYGHSYLDPLYRTIFSLP